MEEKGCTDMGKSLLFSLLFFVLYFSTECTSIVSFLFQPSYHLLLLTIQMLHCLLRDPRTSFGVRFSAGFRERKKKISLEKRV